MTWEVEPTLDIRIIFKDDDLATGRTQLRLPVGLLGSAPSFAASVADLLRPLSTCAIPRYTISLTVHDNTATTSGPGAAVEPAVFIFETATEDDRWTLHVPGFKTAKYTTTGTYPGIEVDPTDSNVQALVAALTDGLNGIAPVTSYNDDLTALTAAYRQIRPQHLNRYR